MTRSSRNVLLGLAAATVLATIAIGLVATMGERSWLLGDQDTDTIEFTNYTAPTDDDALLTDDVLDDKRPEFDSALVDRRPVKGWLVNASSAVVRLDAPAIRPDIEPALLVSYPSYAQAMKNAALAVLPSINLIDGKAKQVDDGLYAALDQAYFEGHGAAMPSLLGLIKRLHDKADKRTPAADYLAAGLSLAGDPVGLSVKARELADSFRADEVRSKPIAFYTWTPTLSACFRVLRFFAEPIRDVAVSQEVARVLGDDPALLAEYRKALLFYGRLSNPLAGNSPADQIGKVRPAHARRSRSSRHRRRETELFTKVFPLGPPHDANLMRTLITAIRSGRVDLKPRKDGGWYDYQVYALETLLLPERGPESNHLLLTKSYKKRMLEAFQALVTKRRETHARSMAKSAEPIVRPEALTELAPRLRVEPCPSYFLRTARSYSFLTDFLESAVGELTLKTLHGLRESGPRDHDLLTELRFMRGLFYGLYLLSAEDIGLKPALLADEPVDRAACEQTATRWLAHYQSDPDLAADTRVAIPVMYDPGTGTSRVWMTVGVRLARLDARYARAPKVRPEKGGGTWEDVETDKLVPAGYLIPVDEFAEVEISGSRVLNRGELRTVCDRFKTKAAIVEALRVPVRR